MIELCCEYLSVRCIWLYVLIMSRTHFSVNPHSIFPWMSRNTLLETGAISEVIRTYMIRTYSRYQSCYLLVLASLAIFNDFLLSCWLLLLRSITRRWRILDTELSPNTHKCTHTLTNIQIPINAITHLNLHTYTYPYTHSHKNIHTRKTNTSQQKSKSHCSNSKC